jgi:glycosyltransferase involved in cell wall biosynthesis
MPKTLSVALITKNETANLPRTLASVRWASEIVVVDSGSTDTTLDIARDAGARVIEEPWKGFAAQKNSAIAHATGDWILSLDADEEVSPELAQEIQAILAGEPAFSAYRIPRLNHFLGHPLRHGGYWPDPKLRLFRRGTAQFADRPVHETMEMIEEMIGESAAPLGRLRAPLIHHCYPTLTDYVEHMNRYSSIAAEALVASGRCGSSWLWLAWHGLLNPAATFLYNYVFRLGFLDGQAGLLQHVNHSFYIHWKYAKAFELARKAPQAPSRPSDLGAPS